MALNKSNGNMYTWLTHTWNTVKGECPHGCTYCYMKRFGKQKPLMFDEKELKTDLGMGNFIFVGSSCDMFAEGINLEWIRKTLEYCSKFNNNYLFQTKNVGRLHYFMEKLPLKSKVCTTIESNRIYPEIMGKCPPPIVRGQWMQSLNNHILKKNQFDLYVTIEPVLDFEIERLVAIIERIKPIQVNIGADSGNNNLPEPSKEKILALIDELKKFTIIDQKRNLSRLLK